MSICFCSSLCFLSFYFLFHVMFGLKIASSAILISGLRASMPHSGLQIPTTQHLPQLCLPQLSMPQSRVCHCFMILQCGNLDFGIENYDDKAWIPASLFVAPNSRLRHQNFTVPKTRLQYRNLQCQSLNFVILILQYQEV